LEQAIDPSQGRQREEEEEKEENDDDDDDDDDDVSVILTEVLAICLGPSIGKLGASLYDSFVNGGNSFVF